ncbi:MAG: hypothetical protein JO147_06275 [Actinobacteria bacterium]|nr:hypothetical protein [Actinomycetota bacterium]
MQIQGSFDCGATCRTPAAGLVLNLAISPATLAIDDYSIADEMSELSAFAAALNLP